MGAGIAAHLAAAGCKTFLLDIVPKGATRSARSSIAKGALKALSKSRPPALMSKAVLHRIIPGNLEDDLDASVEQSDIVIEAVVERLDVKQGLFRKVAAAARPDTVLATNTSGIPISAIAEALPSESRGQLLGLHFFNPPRWMHLLEVIPGEHTSPSITAAASDFCDRVLGKGIVPCRDTPNFIGNRIGIAEMLLSVTAAQTMDLSIEEVDFLNGPLVGRPKTGTFRLGDLVGIDILAHVIGNLRDGLSGDKHSPQFDPLYRIIEVPEFITQLIDSGRLGDKTKAGFYKKTRDEAGKKAVLSLDLKSLKYRSTQPLGEDMLSLLSMQKLMPLKERIVELLKKEGRGADFIRAVLLPLINYSAALVGQICETPQQIDDAMRWGYGWELGPFELMDCIGVGPVIEMLRARGEQPAQYLLSLEEVKGATATVYGQSQAQQTVFTPDSGEQPKVEPKGAIFLSRLRESAVIASNPSAALLDLGDGIACLEFRSKANILDAGVVQLMGDAPEILAQKGYLGLVVGNQADHFCRGANLMHIAGLIAQKKWQGIETAIAELQNAVMNLRHGPLPVVVTPIGQTLGGGTEVALHANSIVAGADLFLGLVEAGVGVLPAGGGLKELARRASSWAAQVPLADPYEKVRIGFESVVTAKISTSAFEARENGFLEPSDAVVFNKSRLIERGKMRALSLVADATPPPDRDEVIEVIGAAGGASLLQGVQQFGWGGYASEHDMLIGKKVVHVLSGGMSLKKSATAQELLDLEREAFVSLCGTEKTFQRIEHMLKTKRPLRN